MIPITRETLANITSYIDAAEAAQSMIRALYRVLDLRDEAVRFFDGDAALAEMFVSDIDAALAGAQTDDALDAYDREHPPAALRDALAERASEDEGDLRLANLAVKQRDEAWQQRDALAAENARLRAWVVENLRDLDDDEDVLTAIQELEDSHQVWREVGARVVEAAGVDSLVRVPDLIARLRAQVQAVEALCDEAESSDDAPSFGTTAVRAALATTETGEES
jgi:hypothetical protein